MKIGGKKMNLTLAELKEKLSLLDELVVLELLDLTSIDILDRFEDIVEDNYDQLIKEIN